MTDHALSDGLDLALGLLHLGVDGAGIEHFLVIAVELRVCPAFLAGQGIHGRNLFHWLSFLPSVNRDLHIKLLHAVIGLESTEDRHIPLSVALLDGHIIRQEVADGIDAFILLAQAYQIRLEQASPGFAVRFNAKILLAEDTGGVTGPAIQDTDDAVGSPVL